MNFMRNTYIIVVNYMLVRVTKIGGHFLRNALKIRFPFARAFVVGVVA
jgi:hypothetical protein